VRRIINFLWPFTAYRDANRGSMLERAAAVRYNKILSKALPTYINRWAVCSTVELFLTEVAPKFMVPLIGLLFSISFCLLLHLIQVYVLFKRVD